MRDRATNKDKIKSYLVATVGSLLPYPKSPDDGLGELFDEVQRQSIYDDAKIFADLIPKQNVKKLCRKYEAAKNDPDFNLKQFVQRHFDDLILEQPKNKIAEKGQSVDQYISETWDSLENRHRRNKGSLLGLPNPYIVPGGRFTEQFYWDSYFIMLGLARENRWNMIEGMLKNFTFMIRKFGFIPNANRTYFLSRSQPPFLSHMVRLLSEHKGKSVFVEYLPYLIAEYRFWMRGYAKLAKGPHAEYARLVKLEDDEFMNRYYDNKATPRPEEFKNDTDRANLLPERGSNEIFVHLRAAAESGWDFSSRWLRDPHIIESIHTSDIIPVDLNCLLYQLETTIVEAYGIMKLPRLEKKFQKIADRRKVAIQKYCWNSDAGFFMDYDFKSNQQTSSLSLAGVFPLYAQIATPDQAQSVSEVINKEFLKTGGLITTTVQTEQQWDSPNGWAPLQYIAIQGLRNYGYYELADEIKRRWVKTNLQIFEQEHKLVEKYNVIDCCKLAGGGEYILQDGFGWTNGVLEDLLSESNS